MQVQINGLSTHIEFSGRTRGPVVMLSHSLSTSMDMWRPQLAALESRFRVLRYDTRGHGQTQAPGADFDIHDLADDVAAILGHFGLERVHFVGLSMGGMIGQALAIRHPDLVERLVLSNTVCAYGSAARPIWEERIRSASGPTGLEPVVEPTARRWFTKHYYETEPDTIEWIRSMVRETSVAGYVACCKALMQLDLEARLPEIQAPTLILAGAQDPTTTVADAQRILAGIPGAQLVVMEAAAHMSNIEQPAAYLARLLAFLEDGTVEP